MADTDDDKVIGTVEALFDFTASDSVGLSFSRGDKINVHQQNETGWWEGSLPDGKRGWFPSNFTTTIGEEGAAVTKKWIEQTSANGHVFYYNVTTGESVWEIPKQEEGFVDERRMSLFPYQMSGQRDDLESKLPDGWTIHETNDGKFFYFNQQTKQASWTPPTENGDGAPSTTTATTTSTTTTSKQNAAATTTTTAAGDDLPANWFVKKLPDGRFYYYNSVNNDTVWSKDDISKTTEDVFKEVAERNRQLATKTQTAIEALAKWSTAEGASKPNAVWGTLIQRCIQAFEKYNATAKIGDKAMFVENVKVVVNSIRELIVASGTTNLQSPALVKSKALAQHHRILTDNLAKLVLSAKLASGVWPPPDAVSKMQTVVIEILTALKLFVTTAGELNIQVDMEVVAKSMTAKQAPKIIHPKPKSTSLVDSAAKKPIATPTAPAIVQKNITSSKIGSPVVPPSNRKPVSLALPTILPPSSSPPLNVKVRTSATAPPTQAPAPTVAAPAPVPAPSAASSAAPIVTSPLAKSSSSSNSTETLPESEPDEIEKAILQEEQALEAAAEAAGIAEESDESEAASVVVYDSSADQRRIAKMDEASITVKSSIEDILEYIKKSGFVKNTGDTKLVTMASTVVANVGAVLEVSDEIIDQFANTSFDVSATHVSKENLVSVISGLVGTAQQAIEPLAPQDALKNVMVAVQSTVNAVHQHVIACKQLIEFKEEAENDMLQQSLGFSSSGTFVPPPGYVPKRSMSLAVITLKPEGTAPAEAGPQEAPPPSNQSLDGLKSPRHNSMSELPNPSSSKPHLATSQSTLNIAKIAAGAVDPDDLEGTETLRRRSSKISAFFGEEVGSKGSKLSTFFSTSAPADSDDAHSSHKKKSFLGVDYQSDELVLTMEGKVKGGTLAAMVERLTQHDQAETEFMLAFLLTYRSFMSANGFLDLLIARYHLKPKEELDGNDLKLFNMKKLTPARLRVINVIKLWVDNYFDDFKDDLLLQRVYKFVREDIQETLKNPADHLLKLLQKKTQGTISRKMVFSGKAPIPVMGSKLKSGKFTILDLEPLEVARQLCLLESRLFNAIQASECLGKAWSDPKMHKYAENIRAMIERSNQLTAWVASSIILEENVKIRVKLVQHFLVIADKLRSLNNFNSLMAILAAFNSAPVHRLQRTWNGTASKDKKLLEGLKQVMDSTGNFSNYRKTLHSIQPPCVPFLGTYLTDLTFIEDGNKDMLNADKQLINFDKRLKVAVVIREIQQYQSMQYCLQPVDIIEQYLVSKFKTVRSIDDLYDLSLKIEPRESNDDTVLRLLQESGFV